MQGRTGTRPEAQAEKQGRRAVGFLQEEEQGVRDEAHRGGLGTESKQGLQQGRMKVPWSRSPRVHYSKAMSAAGWQR